MSYVDRVVDTGGVCFEIPQTENFQVVKFYTTVLLGKEIIKKFYNNLEFEYTQVFQEKQDKYT